MPLRPGAPPSETIPELHTLSGVYAIGLIIRNQLFVYIGSSCHIARRWQDHIRNLNNNDHVNDRLQRCWNKYGNSSFVFTVLEQCVVEKLAEKEQFWFGVFPNRLNVLDFARSSRGYKHTEAVKKIISNVHRGRTKSAEHRRKISAKLKGRAGRKHNERAKTLISIKNKGNRSRTGMPHLEETKQKLSQVMKGRKPPISTIEASVRAWKGQKHTEETRAKMRASHKARLEEMRACL